MICHEYRTIDEIPGEFYGLGDRLYDTSNIALKASERPVSRHFVKAYCVCNGSEVLGRAVLYYNRFIIRASKAPLYAIGNYECIDDIKASTTLLQYIENDVRSMSGQILVGPLNGFLIYDYSFNARNEDFFLTMRKHKDYYKAQWEDFGFRKNIKYLSTITKDINYDAGLKPSKRRYFEDLGIVIDSLRLDTIYDEANHIRLLYRAILGSKYDLDPFSNRDLVERMAGENHDSLETIFLARDMQKKGKVVGFYINHKDTYTYEDRMVIRTLVRNPEERYSGLGYYMQAYLLNYMEERNFTSMIHSYIMAGMPDQKNLKAFKGEPFHTHYMYAKVLK